MNKTFLSVARIFAIITGIFFIFPLGVLIFPLVLAYFNFKAASIYDKAKRGEATKEQVTKYSIYLIFITRIGGIFGLLATTGVNSEQSNHSTVEQKLKELEELFDRGVVSKSEYEARRKYIINSI